MALPKKGDVPPWLQSAAKKKVAKMKKHHKKKPNSHAPVGSGGRFAALTDSLDKKPGVTDPKALAAAIGRRKYGKKNFAAMGKK